MISFPPIEVTPLITDLLAQQVPVALGISGGKDSTAMALATTDYLDQIGHKGPRLLIHSDLGRIEWKASLPMCQVLAERLGLELVVVKRQAGDLMDRWLVRWHNNVERYAQLQCVKLILPWSTASMRFCTSELKTAVICRELIKRFPDYTILSSVGLRREESTTRAKAPVCQAQPRLLSATHNTSGYNWHPLLAWSLQQVLAYHRLRAFPLHEAYTRYGTTRVSCAFCILSSLHDLIQAATCPDNHDIYRELVALEIRSTFSFQGRWLGDIAPHLLSEEMLTGVREAKRRAVLREKVEALIPEHLLYSKGWPTVMPTQAEAVLLSKIRQSVAECMEIMIAYTEPEAILARYAELIACNMQRQNKIAVPAPPHTIQKSLWGTGAIE